MNRCRKCGRGRPKDFTRRSIREGLQAALREIEDKDKFFALGYLVSAVEIACAYLDGLCYVCGDELKER